MFGDQGRGVKTYRTLEEGGPRPEAVLGKLGLLIQGPPKIRIFHPPPQIFGDLTPPYPGLHYISAPRK